MSERRKLHCAIQQMQCNLQQKLPRAAFENVPGEYETAFTICQKGNEICRGSESKGSLTAVSLDIGCPSGWKPIGIHHTHPGGNSNPSDADYSEMKKLRLQRMCISVPSGDNAGDMECYNVDE
jgi:proteasome lid subunit RPN8/RPN11